jgi:hypothetical protein
VTTPAATGTSSFTFTSARIARSSVQAKAHTIETLTADPFIFYSSGVDSGYVLHREPTSDFEPNISTLIAQTMSTSYVDQGVGRDSYYKLAAVDIHGNLSSYAFSGANLPAAAETQSQALRILPIRPNPLAREAIVVSFAVVPAAPARLELWDIVGRRLQSRDVGGAAGPKTLVLGRGGDLMSGLYLVRLTQEGRAVTRTFNCASLS